MAIIDSPNGSRPPGSPDGDPGEAAVTNPAAGAVAESSATGRPAWPKADTAVAARGSAPGASSGPGMPTQPPATPAPEPRKPTGLKADLAMVIRATTEAARDRSLEAVETEAAEVAEIIRTASTAGAVAIRQRSAEDIAAIGEWSKAEIARIEAETQGRLDAQTAALEAELVAHASTVEARVGGVEETIARYHQRMQAYFEVFSKEEDPARLATMAETMPDPPALDAWRAVDDIAAGAGTPAGAPGVPVEVVPVEVVPVEVAPVDHDALMAAMEAEAVAAAGNASPTEAAGIVPQASPAPVAKLPRHEPGVAPDDRTDVSAATGKSPTGRSAAVIGGRVDTRSDAEPVSSQIIVTGLVSVASIAGFKRGLARLTGIRAVTVASGPEGAFVFNVSHSPDVRFRELVPTVAGFSAEVTGDVNGVVRVTARDPEVEG
jgi:hypothetical protein